MNRLGRFINTSVIRTGYGIDEQVNLIGMICLIIMHRSAAVKDVMRCAHALARPRALRSLITELTGIDLSDDTDGNYNSITAIEDLCSQRHINVIVYNCMDKHIVFQFGSIEAPYSLHIMQEECKIDDVTTRTFYHEIKNINIFLSDRFKSDKGDGRLYYYDTKQPGINSTNRAVKDRDPRIKRARLAPSLQVNEERSSTYSIDVKSTNDDKSLTFDVTTIDSMQEARHILGPSTKVQVNPLEIIYVPEPVNRPSYDPVNEDVIKQHIPALLHTNQLNNSQVLHYKSCIDCQKTIYVVPNKQIFRAKRWCKNFTPTFTCTVDPKAVTSRPTPVGFMNESSKCFKNSF